MVGSISRARLSFSLLVEQVVQHGYARCSEIWGFSEADFLAVAQGEGFGFSGQANVVAQNEDWVG